MLKNGLKRAVFAAAMGVRALAAPVAFGVAGAIFDDRGRVLLVRQSYAPGWRLPGGGVGRGEAAPKAILRELSEEVGLTGGSVEFFGLYSRKAGWATNLIALYTVRGGAVNFRPNWEVREILFAELDAPPDGATPGTLRRLAELGGLAPRGDIW
jgi:8-oxo-dGTP pyrophosphatase MutT (NUDIX family)